MWKIETITKDKTISQYAGGKGDLSRDDCTHFDLLWSNKFALKPVKRG